MESIYHLSWFNEDGYGPTNGIYVVSKGKDVEEAIKNSVEHLKEVYNEDDKSLSEKFEHFASVDISELNVITSGNIGF